MKRFAVLGLIAGLVGGALILGGVWFFHEQDRQREFAACLASARWASSFPFAAGDPWPCRRFARGDDDERAMTRVAVENLSDLADLTQAAAKGGAPRKVMR